MRCLLISCRKQKDEKSGEELMFLTLSKLPKRMKNGGLFYPKPSELLVHACVNKSKAPMDYENFEKVNPGALCEVTFGTNEYTQKAFVAKIDVLVTIYPEEDLYV